MKIVEKKPGHDEKLSKLQVKLSNPLSLCWQVTKTMIITTPREDSFAAYLFPFLIGRSRLQKSGESEVRILQMTALLNF